MRRRSVPILIGILSATACAAGDSDGPIGTITVSTAKPAWLRPSSAGDASQVESVHQDPRSEVRTAFEWLMLGRIQCGRRPRECVVDHLAVPGSPVHAALTDEFQRRVRHGIVATSRGSHRHRIGEVMVLSADRAEVRACHTDDVVLVVGGSDGRPSAVYDESLVSHWSTWALEKNDGTWRWSEESVDQQAHGEDVCAS